MLWHVLDVRAIWVQEFAVALAEEVPVLGWLPAISWIGFLKDDHQTIAAERNLQIRRFPLQRGFSRFPVCYLIDEGRRIATRLQKVSNGSRGSPLILCSPHYFSVAGLWPAPRVYYATDMFRFWGEDQRRIERMEKALCQAVDLVCPDSHRIAHYMTEELSVPKNKIVVLPMATRAENVLPRCPERPFPLALDLADLPGPVAGVIGNLAANMDWGLLERVIERTPWLSWAFVGPTEMPVDDPAQRRARRTLQELGGRVRFTGYKPYGMLRDYARSVHVAILPYRKREPTFSGSSTRFYEHLAACRPMLATPALEELLHKEPLLRLVHSAEEMVVELEKLRAQDFRDGYEEMRWKASQKETWEARARVMKKALEDLPAVNRC